jgi:integrase
MTLKLALRNDVWQVTGTVTLPGGEKLRVRKSTGYTKHQKSFASEVLSRLLHDAMTGRLGSEGRTYETVADAVDLYLGRPNPPGLTDQQVLMRFARRFGGVRLDQVRAADVMVYTQGRGNKPGTVAREINSINAMFKYARDCGLGVADFVLKKPSVDDERARWLSEVERDRLIEACGEEIQGIVRFLFFTGARLGEAFKLEWKDVHEGKAFFSTRKGKHKKTRVRGVPLVDGILPEVRGDGLVWPSPSGAMWDRSNFYKPFNRACESAGIVDFHPHDCRHTFATLLVQKGASLRAVADLLGHTSLAMVMRYSHMSPSHLTSTVELLKVS